jgi:AcrR family transcriptional regulator
MANSISPPERRLQIFSAALDLLSREGYHETSIDAIALRAGLAKGTLYWYFKSKRELLIALFRHIMQELVIDWRASIEAHTHSPTEQLRASLSFFRSHATDVATVFGIMIQARATNPQDEELARVTLETTQMASQLLEENIARGVASGEFRPVSPSQVGFVLISLLAGLSLRMRSGSWQEQWPALMDAIESLVSHGLLASPGLQSGPTQGES